MLRNFGTISQILYLKKNKKMRQMLRKTWKDKVTKVAARKKKI